MGLQLLFMDDNAPCHRTVAAEQLLESEDIERIDWSARYPDLNPIEHVWDFLGRRLAARTLPPVTIRELRLALQDEWTAMPQQLFDTLILSMGRRCENLPSSQGRSYSLLKTGCFLLDTHHRDVSAFSRIALHATFSIKLLFIPLISLLVKRELTKETPDSITQPIAIMPLSRMLNSTFAMPNIIDSHDMGLRTVLQSRRPKVNAYSTPILTKERAYSENISW
ncbi:transposable element Tcb1 transposase [Trichonephila clavipes]|nr:transposable element Tcb1 transposase [Trichonephila clavipes]